MNAYTKEINQPEQVCTSIKWLCVTLDAKNENGDLNKVIKNQYQP